MPVSRARELQREEIIRAAATAFGEGGYGGTTLDAVAVKAGISKATLYTYVRSKEELLCLVFERTMDSFQVELERIIEQRLSPEETLRRIIRSQVTQVATHLPFLTVFFSQESDLPAKMARRIAREKREYDRAVERIVDQGIKRKTLRPVPPTLLVFALLGMCNWLYKWYRASGPSRPEEIGDVFVDLLEKGYLRRGGEADGVDLAGQLKRIEVTLGELKGRLGSVAAPAQRRQRSRPANRTSPR